MTAPASLGEVELEDVVVHPTAYFYRTRSALTAKQLENLLGGLGSDGHRRRLTTTLAGKPPVYLSAVIRKHQRSPSFLPGSAVHELRYSIVLLVSCGDVLSVHVTGAGRWSNAFLNKLASKIEADVIGSALSDGATFQKVKMRAMSISRNVVRTRTLESPELESVMPTQGLSRQIPEYAQVQKGTQRISATPTTARVSLTSRPLTIDEYVTWFKAQRRLFLQHIKKPGPTHFLGRFAAPVEMTTLDSKGIVPKGVLLSLDWLVEGIASGAVELQEKSGNDWAPVKDPAALIHKISETGEVGAATSARAYELTFANVKEKLSLYRNKKSFRLGGKLINRLSVLDITTGARESLSERIQAEGALLVTLSDIQYAYAFGQLFRDRTLLTQVPVIRELLVAVAPLASCASEKGDQLAKTKAFSADSIFATIENHISKTLEEPILILDDLGDEWADFIGVSSNASSPRISLYHAKHKPNTGTGASAFHDVVSQALKNLGRVTVRKDELIARKRSTWQATWNPTAVSRLRRGKTVDKAIAAYADASNHTTLRSRVCLVVSFVSKKEIDAMLAKLEASAPDALDVKAHEAQLIHLLVAFVASTREASAQPVVYCAP